MVSSIIDVESSTINGIPLISRATNVARLGGIGNPNSTKAFLELNPPQESELKKALLSVFISGRNLSSGVRWRVKYCGVTLSREFRPQVLVNSGNAVHAALIYDITPVALKDANIHEVAVSYDGAHPITVDGISMFMMYKHRDSYSVVRYLVGVKVLEPGSSTSLNVSTQLLDENNNLALSFYTPSRQSALEISVDGVYLGTFTGSVGVDELEVPLRTSGTVNELCFKHVARGIHTSPMRILEIALMSIRLRKPDFDISTEINDDRIRFYIRNIGETTPDNAMLILLSRGIPLYKARIKRLKPEENAVVDVPIKALRGNRNFIARIVWNKAGHTFFKDMRINI